MGKAIWLIVIAALLGALAFTPVDAAGPSQDAIAAVVPHMTAISDGALCSFGGSCKITANVTYSTSVGIFGNAVPDFAIEDVTLRTSCPVQAVTTTPPPAGPLGLVSIGTLYLRTWCLVHAGDVMLVVYHQTTSGFVFNAAAPATHALSPQVFRFIQPAPVGG